MDLFNKIFGRKEVNSEDVFQLNYFLAYTFFPSAIESYNKGETTMNEILNFIPFLKQKKSQWSHIYKLIKVTDSGINSVGIRTIIIELPHNHPLAKAHIIIIQQNETLNNAKYYILEKAIIGNGYMLCSADSSGNHYNYGSVSSIPEMSDLVNQISFSEWEKSSEDKQTNESQSISNASISNLQPPITQIKSQDTIKKEDIEDIVEQCWDLIEFGKLHGKMKVGTCTDKNTGEKYKSLVFVDKNEKRLIVRFSKSLGELTPAQIVQEKHILRIARLKNGSYKLFKAKIAHLSLFSADWCRPSRDLIKSLQKHGLTNYSIIDVDSQIDISERFHIIAIPAIVISDEDGNIVKKLLGYDEDEHQVFELQDFLRKTQYKVIPNPNGKIIADIAFEKALNQFQLMKAKYGDKLGVEEDELFLLCCASQVDFSQFESPERLSSSYKMLFDKIYKYIYPKKSSRDWIWTFESQNPGASFVDPEEWRYCDSCKIDIFEKRFGKMSTAPNAKGEIISFFVDCNNNITAANIGKYAARYLSSNLVENKDKLIVHTLPINPNKQDFAISYVVEVSDTSVYDAPEFVKEYIMQRLQFFSSILPYLASDKLPNYKQTIKNLYILMKDEAHNFTVNILAEVEHDPKRFSLHENLYANNHDDPSNDFLASIKDIIFDATIL